MCANGFSKEGKMKNPTVTSKPASPSDHDGVDELQSLARRLDGLEKKLDQIIHMLSKLGSQSEQEKRIHWE